MTIGIDWSWWLLTTVKILTNSAIMISSCRSKVQLNYSILLQFEMVGLDPIDEGLKMVQG